MEKYLNPFLYFSFLTLITYFIYICAIIWLIYLDLWARTRPVSFPSVFITFGSCAWPVIGAK